jgi:hypothetical protein
MRARIDHDEVRRLHAAGETDRAIALRVHCSEVYARLIRSNQVPTAAERKALGLKSKSRKVQGSLHGKPARGMPPINHPAIMQARTLYPGKVRPSSSPVLKSGENSAKIGGLITKGKWKGYTVYSLTLEERATCPTTCHHWRSCFGNHMNHAHRMQHGPRLEARIRAEIDALCKKHPAGVAVRLHILGDFYSVEYVHLWRDLLAAHDNLVCFGFTARWDNYNDMIAHALRVMVSDHWDRFAIRFSNAPDPVPRTISIEHPLQCPGDSIVCPEQLGKSESCSTCALCWQSTERIAFVQH